MNIFSIFTRKRDALLKNGPFIVLCVTKKNGLSAESAFAMRKIISDSNPIDFLFLNPGTFNVFFIEDDTGIQRAAALAKDLRDFAAKNIISQFGVGIKSGLVYVQLATDGRFNSYPIGETISLAHKAALMETENVL